MSLRGVYDVAISISYSNIGKYVNSLSRLPRLSARNDQKKLSFRIILSQTKQRHCEERLATWQSQ
jgi:hypothetical protein